MQVLVRDNNVDQALKALKKKMQREGIFREMKLRGHYEKPSEKKAREKAEAVRRARKLARKKLQREGLLPMKPKPVFGAGPGGAERRRSGGGRGGAWTALSRRPSSETSGFEYEKEFEYENAGLEARVFALAVAAVPKLSGRGLNYCGNTAWNTDFAASSTSSATLVCGCADSSTGSARNSTGAADGMSAGGIGRRGSSARVVE